MISPRRPSPGHVELLPVLRVVERRTQAGSDSDDRLTWQSAITYLSLIKVFARASSNARTSLCYGIEEIELALTGQETGVLEPETTR
jgi:hypothetical protein